MLLAAKLARGACARCGKACDAESASGFDFHHESLEQKVVAIGDISNGRRVFEREIGKCRLLCCECHRLATAEQHRQGLLSRKRVKLA